MEVERMQGIAWLDQKKRRQGTADMEKRGGQEGWDGAFGSWMSEGQEMDTPGTELPIDPGRPAHLGDQRKDLRGFVPAHPGTRRSTLADRFQVSIIAGRRWHRWAAHGYGLRDTPVSLTRECSCFPERPHTTWSSAPDRSPPSLSGAARPRCMPDSPTVPVMEDGNRRLHLSRVLPKIALYRMRRQVHPVRETGEAGPIRTDQRHMH
jgi:hypothetical protein